MLAGVPWGVDAAVAAILRRLTSVGDGDMDREGGLDIEVSCGSWSAVAQVN